MTVSVALVEIQLVNMFEVRGGPSCVTQPARRLLAFLAVQEHRVTRDYAAYSLWPDSAEVRASASLRTAIWSLGASADTLVRVTPSSIGLAPAVKVDYHHLSETARLVASAELAEDWGVEASSYAGELLPDWYEEWLVRSRERWKEIRLQALDAIACRHLAERRFLAAIEASLTAIAIEPLRETTRQLLIRAHLAQGNRAQALAEYRSFCRHLDAELGIIPSAELAGIVAIAGLGA